MFSFSDYPCQRFSNNARPSGYIRASLWFMYMFVGVSRAFKLIDAICEIAEYHTDRVSDDVFFDKGFAFR